MKQRLFKFLTWAFLLTATISAHARSPAPHAIENPDEIAAAVRSLSSQTPFSVSSLTFFGDSLYAASNIGLLQIDHGGVRRLLRWDKNDPLVGGVWADPVHNLLFAHDVGRGYMRVFDGQNWDLAPVPTLPRNFASRGDVPKGFHSFSSGKDFYLVGRGGIWRWSSSERVWKSQITPPIPQLSGVADAFFADGKIFSVVRNEPFHGLVSEEEYESDSVHYFDGEWHTVPNRTGKNFFLMSVSGAGERGYGCTESHNVVEITREAVSEIQGLPACERVLASPDAAIFYTREGFLMWEKGPAWLKVAPPPAAGPEPEHPLAFAVKGRTVAYAINSIVDKQRSDRKSNRFEFTRETRLWISDQGALRAVVIPGVQVRPGVPQSFVTFHSGTPLLQEEALPSCNRCR
jgi:hypothetical protein